MSNYKKIAEEARVFKINPVGKSEKDLILAIRAAKAKILIEKKKVEEKPVVRKKVEEKPVEKLVDPLKTKEEFDTIVVSKGKMEVRRYTKEIHGEDFIKNAKQFTKNSAYSMEVFNSKDKATKCPSCGHCFDLTN